MRASIRKQDLSSEYLTPEGCHIIEVSNSEDDPELSVARARVEPGVTTRWHRLTGIAERYCIVSGRGSMELADQPPRAVRPGDVVLIPPMCRQRITNTGQEDLIFLAVCTPRFSGAAYEDIDLAVPPRHSPQ